MSTHTHRNQKLVRSAAEQALASRSISSRTVKLLRGRRLLKRSTRFREASQFPGETRMLFFEYSVSNAHSLSGRDKVMGYLGFDRKFNLLSVDQRYPADGRFYKMNRRWVRQK